MKRSLNTGYQQTPTSACIAPANTRTGTHRQNANHQHVSQYAICRLNDRWYDNVSKVWNIPEIRQSQLLRSWRCLVQELWRT